MHSRFRRAMSGLAAAAITVLPAAPAFADEGHGPKGKPGAVTPVASANPKSVGVPAPNVLSPELIEAIVAQGSWKLENPSDLTSYYGYDNDGPPLPGPGDLLSAIPRREATETEPEKDTDLVLPDQHGPDPHCQYGAHV